MIKIQIKTKKHKPVLALFALGVILVASAHPAVFASDMTPTNILNLTNDSRKEAGVEPLTLNATLSAAAKAKAKDMVENDYFAHTSPKGLSPWHWVSETGYSYRYAGENLAINYETAKNEHKAWMKSPTHRANILSSQYSEVGIAVMEGKIDGKSTRVTVVMFGQPKIVPVAAPKEEAPLPEAVKGVSEESVAVPAETQAPVSEPVPVIAPEAKGFWFNSDVYRFASLGLIELVLVLSALYFFYKDAIEYVALEKGLHMAFSGNGSLTTSDLDLLDLEHRDKEVVLAQLE